MCSLGMTPRSESGVALTIIMKRMVVSPCFLKSFERVKYRSTYQSNQGAPDRQADVIYSDAVVLQADADARVSSFLKTRRNGVAKCDTSRMVTFAGPLFRQTFVSLKNVNSLQPLRTSFTRHTPGRR